MSELFLKIINMSISASWLVLAVLLLRLVLKKAPKWVCVLLWGFVAIRLICPFSIESVLSLIPSAQTVSPEIMLDQTPQISTGIGSLDSVINPILTGTFAPEPFASANPLQILIPVCANFWILGILIMLTYTAVSYILLRRKVATAVLLRDDIFQSENVASPFVLGIIKPKIYLPFQMDGQSLQHVIAHEQAHIRRKDHWWKPLGFLLLALHWFNPLMWLGYVLLCRDIELACDEKVIRRMDNDSKADYTQALVSCSVSRRSIAACPLAFGEVGVTERVKSVMHYKKPAFWIVVAAVVACAVVAVCFLTNPLEQTSLCKLEADEASMPRLLRNVQTMTIAYEENHITIGSQAEIRSLLEAMAKINVSTEPISLNRSEDRSKDFSIMINAGAELHFNKTFTEFWVDNHVKPSLSHRITNPQATQALLLGFLDSPAATASEVLLSLIDEIAYNPDCAASSNPFTYIEAKKDRFNEILSYGSTAVDVFVGQLRTGDNGLPSYIMAVACAQLTGIGDKNAGADWATAQQWLSLYDRHMSNAFLDSGPMLTLYGSLKTYYKNTDGTWQVDGRFYKHRLVITGRLPNAATDTTFVYLSNLENITFTQAWNAAGFGSDKAAFFSPEEAILVDWTTDGSASVSQIGGANMPTSSGGTLFALEPLDNAISQAILAQNDGDKFLSPPTGFFPVEAHRLLGIVFQNNAPSAEQTAYTEDLAVYVQYVYLRYSYYDGTLESIAGAAGPAMIVFSKEQDGGYLFKEFWEPRDGSLYEEDIRKMFPEDIAAAALDLDSNALEAQCLVKARDYVAAMGE